MGLTKVRYVVILFQCLFRDEIVIVEKDHRCEGVGMHGLREPRYLLHLTEVARGR